MRCLPQVRNVVRLLTSPPLLAVRDFICVLYIRVSLSPCSLFPFLLHDDVIQFNFGLSARPELSRVVQRSNSAHDTSSLLHPFTPFIAESTATLTTTSPRGTHTMAGFLGMTVQVTLRQGSILHGKVRSVVAGQSLTLDDGTSPQQPTSPHCSTDSLQHSSLRPALHSVCGLYKGQRSRTCKSSIRIQRLPPPYGPQPRISRLPHGRLEPPGRPPSYHHRKTSRRRRCYRDLQPFSSTRLY